MAAIKLNSISADKKQSENIKRNYLYKDLFLDIVNSFSYNAQLNRTEEQRDVAGLFDVEAVKNSIVNAFLTSPGDKILNPTFGVDLRRYMFEPVDIFTSLEMQADIKDRLPLSEPRIELVNVDVEGYPDEQEFRIDLQINVPSLDIYGLSLRSVLNSNGYNFL